MPDTTTNIILVVLVIVMIVVMWIELRVMRRRSKARRQRSARRPDELQDEAHNALITTRAIASTMAERGGAHSDEVDAMLQEAQTAYGRRNYRVAIELTERVKDRLVSLKGAQAAQGDVAKLDTLSSGPASDEPTTKEVLQKQFPPNLIQSRFAISVAEASIEGGSAAGRDVVQARSLLLAARSRFDAEDYGGALSLAHQAEKSANGEAASVPAATPAPAPVAPAAAPAAPVSVPEAPKAPAAVPPGSVCPSCGTPMKADDVFCRKCGTQVVLTNCPSCGASLLADDVFCRKCGTRLQR